MHLEMFFDVLSSWCWLAAPAWARLHTSYAGRVKFAWSIALVDRAEAMGYTRESIDWYYRRTAKMTGTKLNPNWIDGPETGTLHANCVAVAARSLGVDDDRVWVALGAAAMRDGLPMGRLDVAVEVAARAGALDPGALRALATSDEVLEHVRESTDRFRQLGLPQRPSFILTDDIGDEVRLSGTWVYEPLAAAIDALGADVDGYRVYMMEAEPEPARQ